MIGNGGLHRQAAVGTCNYTLNRNRMMSPSWHSHSDGSEWGPGAFEMCSGEVNPPGTNSPQSFEFTRRRRGSLALPVVQDGAERLHVEPEQDDIPVLYHVLLALGADQALFPGGKEYVVQDIRSS